MSTGPVKHTIQEENARFILAILVWFTITILIGTIFFLEPPNTMRDLVIGTTGSLVTVFIQQIQYYNKTGITTDRQKDDTINKMAQANAGLAPKTDVVPIAPGDTKTIVGTEDGTNGPKSSN